MKENQPSNPLGCGLTVLAESLPVVPLGIAWLEKEINHVDTISTADMFLMAGMEIGRGFLALSSYNAILNQNMGTLDALLVGSIFYLTLGVTELAYSASKVAQYRRNNPRR